MKDEFMHNGNKVRNWKVIILGAVLRKPNHFYDISLQGSIREYKDFSWYKFTFKEIFQCFKIDIIRELEKNRLLVYRYVCPMCNYDFKNKEDAINCCSGEDHD